MKERFEKLIMPFGPQNGPWKNPFLNTPIIPSSGAAATWAWSFDPRIEKDFERKS